MKLKNVKGKEIYNASQNYTDAYPGDYFFYKHDTVVLNEQHSKEKKFHKKSLRNCHSVYRHKSDYIIGIPSALNIQNKV